MSNRTLPTKEEVYKMCRLTRKEIEEIESNNRVTPLNRDKEVAQPLLIDFVFDASGSMGDLYTTLTQEFNTTMLEGLRGVNRRQTAVLRLGGLLFATGRSHIWPGFRSLDELGATPLTTDMFYRPELGNQTALYSAMICGLLWTRRCVEKFAHDIKRTSRGIVVVLTDGANNQEPMETSSVSKIIGDIRKDDTSITPYLAYFKTGDGLDEAGSKALAQSTGFKHMGYYDITSHTINKTREQKFRHFFKLFSRDVAVVA